MRFNCDYLKERRIAKWDYQQEWHDHFVLWPRKVGPKDCRWMEKIQRRRYWYVSCYGVVKGNWQYRAKQ